jgi:hypothetical protein
LGGFLPGRRRKVGAVAWWLTAASRRQQVGEGGYWRRATPHKREGESTTIASQESKIRPDHAPESPSTANRQHDLFSPLFLRALVGRKKEKSAPPRCFLSSIFPMKWAPWETFLYFSHASILRPRGMNSEPSYGNCHPSLFLQNTFNQKEPLVF